MSAIPPIDRPPMAQPALCNSRTSLWASRMPARTWRGRARVRACILGPMDRAQWPPLRRMPLFRWAWPKPRGQHFDVLSGPMLLSDVALPQKSPGAEPRLARHTGNCRGLAGCPRGGCTGHRRPGLAHSSAALAVRPHPICGGALRLAPPAKGLAIPKGDPEAFLVAGIGE